MLNTPIALLPVLTLLTVLSVMDSFKLVGFRAVVSSIGAGAGVALVAWWCSDSIMSAIPVPLLVMTRYIGPVIEETLKAAVIVFLVARGRIAFPVDAAVQGFAVGAGFALVENSVYLADLPSATLMLWVVRGFGTAVLHASTTAVFAMICRALADRHPDRLLVAAVPAWAAAVAIHSGFNHLLIAPALQTAVLLLVLPLVVAFVFERSEKATREWVGAGLDLDIELLHLIESTAFEFTRFRTYLQELRARFPGDVVADMFCLLRIELELSIQAKAMLLAREAGVDVPTDADLEAALAERATLQRSIGRTGLLALKPLQVTSHRDRWHRHLLAQAKR